MPGDTDELREIFLDLAEDDTVTERQEETPGSLAGDEDVTAGLTAVIARMRADLGFDTTLSDEALASVVAGYYRGDTDAEIAEDVGVSGRSVFRARMDLHLLRERDTDAPLDLAVLREHLEADESTGEVAAALDVSASTVRRYRRVLEARRAASRVSDRYRSEFRDVLGAADLADRFTHDVTEDGLGDATEGMETDVSL